MILHTNDGKPIKGDNPLPVTGNVQLTGSIVEDVELIDAATAPTSESFAVGAYKTLTLEIYGTATSVTVEFKGTGPSGAARAIAGVRMSDFVVGTVGAIGEIWQFDVTGLTTFIADLTAVSGGYVTVKGKAVA